MSSWIFWIVVTFIALVFVVPRINRWTCLKAYGQGVEDAGTKNVEFIRSRFEEYVKTNRPMDAASYQRGVEYVVFGIMDWKEIKKDFVYAYKSGSITSEGTNIRRLRRLGTDRAIQLFQLRVPPVILTLLSDNPEMTVLEASIRTKEERSKLPPGALTFGDPQDTPNNAMESDT